MRLLVATLLAAVLPLQACNRKAEPPESTGLTAEELAAEAPASKTDDPFAGTPSAVTYPQPPATRTPVDAADAGPVILELISETAYLNERRQYVVDLLERDMAYLTLVVTDQDGNPVQGAQLEYAISGSSRVVPIGEDPVTDDLGWSEIGVVGGEMGADTLTVTYQDRSLEVLINVISLQSVGFASLDEDQADLRWDALMQARLRFDADNRVAADFPSDVEGHSGKTVKLIGFMMPLESEEKQKHFLLTSNPPSCFFHIPGGPAGAVEVFAQKGIKASWDPILLEGRFETVQGSETGVIYRLHDARVVSR